MKQTAVEWLVEQIMKHDKSFLQFYGAEIEQAKEMEKEQHGKTWDEAIDEYSKYNTFEKYYNETYNKSIKNKG